MLRRFFFALVLIACCRPAFAEDSLVFRSGRAQNTLVELYTSDVSVECNAALEWMSRLAAAKPERLWKRFVPVAMHVSYWDVPGARDTFAKKTFDDFLLRYKGLWGAARLYAPTVAVDGVEWGGWGQGRDVPEALPKEAGILTADGSKRQDHFLVEFIPARKIDAEGLTVHAALLGFGVESRPSEGGNRGRVLKHDFVVLSYKAQAFRLSYGVLSSDFEMPRRKAARAKKYAVAFWVTPTGDSRPIQAAGGYLP